MEALYNQLCVEIILALDKDEKRLNKGLKKLVIIAKETIEQTRKTTSSFWNLMAPANLCLLEILSNGFMNNGNSMEPQGENISNYLK